MHDICGVYRGGVVKRYNKSTNDVYYASICILDLLGTNKDSYAAQAGALLIAQAINDLRMLSRSI